MTTLKLYNTKTRSKEVFEPIDPNNVRMYVCGPTVYDRAHLGNARPVIVFDVLFRLLRHVYGPDHVTYVRNFTDVDDKINKRAAESGRSIGEITDETIQWFLEDMAAVGAMEPTQMPRATQYITEMIAMIKTLIEKNYAYSKPISYGHNSRAAYFKGSKAPEHSFFNVEADKKYGELSGRSVDDMIAGLRSEVGEGKENPMDFVLWKPSNVDEPGWESPWGYGRPGWHIECSAMAKALLGDTFDIHGGGLDLQFPHHENEIAQSCCANDTEAMANVWMHNEMLQVEGKKMSKSLGNFFTVRDLLDQGVPGEVIRFVILTTHYRRPMDWTEKKREEATSWLRRFRSATVGETADTLPDEVFLSILADDLNTAGALQRLSELYVNKQWGALIASAQTIGLLTPELGDWFDAEKRSGSTKLMSEVIAIRQSAKANMDYELADEIRDKLKAVGIELNDVSKVKVSTSVSVIDAVDWYRKKDSENGDVGEIVAKYEEAMARDILEALK